MDVTRGWVAEPTRWDEVHPGQVVVWDEAAGVLAVVVEAEPARLMLMGMDVPGGYRWGLDRWADDARVPVLVQRDVLAGEVIGP